MTYKRSEPIIYYLNVLVKYVVSDPLEARTWKDEYDTWWLGMIVGMW